MEFEILKEALSSSGCRKKQTACGTYVDGKFTLQTNYCLFEGDVCPRLNMPSGTGYELCESNHAEALLAEKLEACGKKSDGVAWLLGHYWACEPCASSLKRVGVTELRIREI